MFEFVGTEGMRRLLSQDEQARAYFETLTAADMCAMDVDDPGAPTHGRVDAHALYLRSVVDDPRCLERIRARIRACVREASEAAEPLLPGVPWRIAVLMDGGFGAQYPHTLGDVVCMPQALLQSAPRHDLVRTLVHERVHVFQRAFPEATRRLLVDRWGLRRIERAAGRVPLARSNPDLDGWVWSEHPSRPDVGVAQVYASACPSHLGDSCARLLTGAPGAPQYEHPYERMAYELAEVLHAGRASEHDPMRLWLHHDLGWP